jgi:hypothetical protein
MRGPVPEKKDVFDRVRAAAPLVRPEEVRQQVTCLPWMPCHSVPTVVPSLHDDDVVPLRARPRNLDGGLNGLTARVPEEEAVQGWVGHHGEKGLHELYVGLGQSDGALDVDDRLGLGDDSSSDVWVGMAERGDSDAGRKVKELATLLYDA